MYNKKGLSQVVTTVIFVSLALIAIGIVWAVINNLVQEGAEGADIQNKCLSIQLEIESVTCDDNTADCAILINRKAGGGVIDGIRAVITDGTTTESLDTDGDLISLGTATHTVPKGAIVLATDVTKASISAYFKSDAGENQVCPGAVESSDITDIVIP